MIYPPPLQKGDCIGVMAPASFVQDGILDEASTIIKSYGYEVFIHPQSHSKHNQSAGTSEEKIDALHDLFSNPKIKAIITAVGGNRASHLLDKIDYNLIRNNPKPIIGFSDVTPLLNAIQHKSDLVTFHGPTCSRLPKIDKKWCDQLFALLSHEEKTLRLNNIESIRTGNAQGRLIGGNLSAFQVLIGTNYMPHSRGNILFIEDINDHISRYDRMLGHLKNSGILNDISGLIIGDFTNTLDNSNNPFGFSLKECVLEHLHGRDIPIVMNVPFGHCHDLPTFPIGAEIELTASKDTVNLTQLKR